MFLHSFAQATQDLFPKLGFQLFRLQFFEDSIPDFLTFKSVCCFIAYCSSSVVWRLYWGFLIPWRLKSF